ncbi:hypothetical protein L1987_06684 [Smallanthus sonchifolius]|uniref:Uncharacterized protein n=1 Tax=Smallanthus sonchifolius TaxID=185202 RepID=A0ACB9JYU8_9ASTR|nr:hypothetical protein L1987_06684 [Smallanthus sonchifolius]
MAQRVEYKHNHVALLDSNMSEAVNFQGIIGFLNRSRLHTALSTDPYISLVYIQQFWDTVHQDTDVVPHVLRATVNNTEIAISEETIRAALALGGNAEDPLSYPGTLIMGCFQRMGYRGRQNDTQARKGGLVGEWRYFMHVIIQCISPRKAATDGLKMALQTAMVALTLNKRFNFALYFYREMVMQINPAEVPVQQQAQVLVQPQIPIPEQVQIPQVVVEIPIHEPVQEEVVHAHEQDLGMNMDDFVDDAVNSPIHEAEGNVVTDDESSSSSSDTILLVTESTDSDASRDFSSDHYERLAAIPLANAGNALFLKQNDQEESLFGILLPDQYLEKDPWLMRGVEDANFVASLIITPPRSKDTSPVITPVPPVITPTASPSTQAQQIADMQALVSKLVQRLDAQGELRIHDTCHTESIQRRDDEDNDLSSNIEGNKDTSGANEEILLLEFFADSEEEEAEKIACLDDIDELFNDKEDDVSDNEIEGGEIVEIEIEKGQEKVTYEGCDGFNVPYNFIQDDVIPEFTYEGITDSMDSFEDITLPEDTADSKVNTDDENIQSKKDTEADTSHTESPKVNEELVMYRNTGMTREQWREVVNSWMKVLPKSQAQPPQKEKYVNKEKCVGRIISWFYDNDTKLFAVKRSDGV